MVNNIVVSCSLNIGCKKGQKDRQPTIHPFLLQLSMLFILQLWNAKFLHGGLNPLVGDVLATIGFFG